MNLLENDENKNIQQHAYWLIKNYDRSIRLLLSSAILSPDYKNWITSKSFVLGSFDHNDLEKSRMGAVSWGLDQ